MITCYGKYDSGDYIMYYLDDTLRGKINRHNFTIV